MSFDFLNLESRTVNQRDKATNFTIAVEMRFPISLQANLARRPKKNRGDWDKKIHFQHFFFVRY